ncbi:hypothetical protein [Pseudomonas aeruginosa]|uniref:hypothetical protein n=1 Tax=Pseudomonas aeruginosa TaxID=287 RepID=UPI0004F28647|nr:hypothetical protein [Pseudomonas aeruginosa]MBG7364466.1 hypothetical protein [Pseudomonas aeruginosa]MBI7117707.1 hypothetical protein [Pseudomonas aeruginosa]MCL8045472.1 hypothetical protein [Pseudomonas aeruginosa]MCV0300064.1 hypothetical protein [Pseudomonas aeruginosa]MCV0362432.1 hypothetical protein [Pseudomonas aeruginosa]
MKSDDSYFAQYKAIYRRIDERLDIRGSALSALVQICINNDGMLPKAARDKFKDCVPDSYYDYIEAATKDILHSSH